MSCCVFFIHLLMGVEAVPTPPCCDQCSGTGGYGMLMTDSPSSIA